MDPADAEAHFDEYAEFTRSIRESGHFVACNRLEPPKSAATVRVRGGKTSVTDGPFVETREQLGGYYLIDVPDLDAANAWAGRYPGAAFGTIEVRPIMPMAAMADA